MLAGAKVTKATVGKDKVTLEVEAGGKKETVEVEKVLMAAGRAVNTEDMGFKEAGVQLDRPRLRQGEPRDAGDHRARASTASATWPARRCWPTREAAKASSWPS